MQDVYGDSWVSRSLQLTQARAVLTDFHREVWRVLFLAMVVGTEEPTVELGQLASPGGTLQLGYLF